MFGALILIGAGALVLGVIFPEQRFSPPLRRTVEIIEAICIAVLLPLALAVMNLYGTLRHANILPSLIVRARQASAAWSAPPPPAGRDGPGRAGGGASRGRAARLGRPADRQRADPAAAAGRPAVPVDNGQPDRAVHAEDAARRAASGDRRGHADDTSRGARTCCGSTSCTSSPPARARRSR